MKTSDLIKIIEQYPTPMYVFDMDEFDARILLIREVLRGKADFCYAMKANPLLIKRADRLAAKFEVCSPGEFEICMKSGIAPEKIVYSGVYKDPVSTKRAVEILAGCGCVTAESPGQLDLLEQCAAETKKTADVLLRVSSGNQFGIDPQEVLCIVQRRDRFPHLKIRGFQYYSGTQKRKSSKIQKELKKLDELILFCRREYGFITDELEYGPGLPVNYFEGDSYNEKEMLGEFGDALSQMNYDGHITVEMGRFAASSCGHYLTRAVDIKTNNGQNYIITDGGNHQMKYYGQNMGMKTPCYEYIRKGPCSPVTQPEKYDIYGALCTVYDVIAREIEIEGPQTGDVFDFQNTGAYSVTEGMSLFLSRDIPPVLSFDQKEGINVLRERVFSSEINCAK